MAVTILFTATRAADFKSVAIKDNSTAWTTGGDMDKANVTDISLSLFGTDKTTPLKIVTFTSDERTTFLAGNDVVLLFSDPRLWSLTYSPDNFYAVQLDVVGGVTVSTQTAFDSYFYIKKIVMAHIADVAVPLDTFYDANKAIAGDLAALTTLDYLSSVISITRENKWRKTYDFLQYNYNL
ncbi:MAG: hypothetical protein ACYC5G_01195 [Candidatus Doudnabacteria bacterium]